MSRARNSRRSTGAGAARADLRAACAAVLLVAAVGCSPSAEGGPPALLGTAPGGVEVVLLAQDESPAVVMDALFEGRVLVDGSGCLRLDAPGRQTVIWPEGFTLGAAGGEMVVRDDRGNTVGRVGDVFRLGGGEVTTLHDGIPLSPEDRERATERCPGRYWIVGSVGPEAS